jgi:MazG family protein
MDAHKLSKALLALHDLVSKLRGTDGCPWDVLQTDSTIKMYLLEEAYEVLDAIERGGPEDVCQELGDLLFQTIFLVRLAEERGEFDLVKVLEQITEKMRYRHPHVFGEAKVESAEEVADNWQKLKRREKEDSETLSVHLQGVPIDLPALLRAHRLRDRASRANRERPDVELRWANVEMTFEALKKAVSISDKEKIGQQVGEILFALVGLTRDWGLNAESLLRQVNQEFIHRAAQMEGKLGIPDRKLDQGADDEADRSCAKGKIKEE